MQPTLLKKFASLIALFGGLIALIASCSYFIRGPFFPHFDHNKAGTVVREEITIIGVVLFILAIASIATAILSMKRNVMRRYFLLLIVLGICDLALLIFVGTINYVPVSFVAAYAARSRRLWVPPRNGIYRHWIDLQGDRGTHEVFCAVGREPRDLAAHRGKPS